jgi:16S rRNA (cytosine967-C5)-methyltransferase
VFLAIPQARSYGANLVKHIDKPREKVVEILHRAEEGFFADSSLDQARQYFGARDSAFILELVYGTLRNRSRLDWALNLLSKQPLENTDTWTRNILRMGAYQLLFLDRVPASAAVNTATELAKVHGKKQGYVNGLLRNLDRKRRTIAFPGPEDLVKRLSVLHSHPEWLVRRWLERYGAETTEMLLGTNNLPAPLVIRCNTLKSTRGQLNAALASQGAESRETSYSPTGLEILSSPGIRALPAYEQGWFMVQDEAAQLISLLLAPGPGENVLDACAAPGGKAAHMAELMGDRGNIVALENDYTRIVRIRENIGRLGLKIITPEKGDATQYREGPFDKVLIDAPCSGLGVLRRHPDGRWIKNERIIAERAAVQQRILENCANLLKPGGVLVYSTCTTEPEENEGIINAFLTSKGGYFTIDDPRPFLPVHAATFVDDTGFFRTFPNGSGMDGFFGVRLVRTL